MMTTAALALVFGASVACDAPPGTVVARLMMSGGDGNPIAYTMHGPGSSNGPDFRIRGSVIVVGLHGIAPAHCGQKWNLSVTATQP